jgi:hypothetical protein
MAVSKADLMVDTRLTEVVSTELGEFVCRGMSRAAASRVLAAYENDTVSGDEFENVVLAEGLADPALTLDEVRAWRAVAPASAGQEFTEIRQAIFRLSGMLPEQVDERMHPLAEATPPSSTDSAGT